MAELQLLCVISQMKPDTWMPLYVSSYLADTAHLSTAEHGAYLLLMMHAWVNNGVLPDDDERLRRVTRMDVKAWKSSCSELRSFFYPCEEGLRNRRMDKELQRAQALIDQRTEAGKASAEKRKQVRNTQRQVNERSTSVATDSQRNGRPIPLPIQKPLEQETVLGSPTLLSSIDASEPQSQKPLHPPLADVAEKSIAISAEMVEKADDASTALQALCRETWSAYRQAFAERYGADPVRNATVNAKIKQICQRIGIESPGVARFFVGHPNAHYAQRMHSVGDLLANCEGLCAQFRSGVAVTQTTARNNDRTGAMMESVNAILRRRGEL